MNKASSYKKFGKKEFEYMLRYSCIKHQLGFMQEVSEKWDSWEHIYEVSTKNKAVDILIFSSVDIRTSYTRDKGSDAVRVVIRWNTKNGPVFKRLAKHKRIETLFDNLSTTLLTTKQTVFNLKYSEFKKISATA